MKRLVHNSITCLGCGEKLISRHRHDFVACGCNNATFVDGGLDYSRFGGKDLNLLQDDALYDDAPHEKIREIFERGSRGKDGDEPLHYIKLKDMTDEHLKGTIEYEKTYRPDNPYLKIYREELKFRK